MDFLSHPVVAIVLLLGILVFVHELGHFLVGKLFGIPVETFSMGFGPVIFGFNRAYTHYRICALPLGGYVKFYGSSRSEVVPDALKGKEFFSSTVTARLCTIMAGPLANIILAIAVFTGMAMYGLHQPPAIIGEIMSGSPAAKAGLLFGDLVLSIDGQPVTSWKDVQRKIGDAPDRSLSFQIRRDEKILEVSVVPDSVRDDDLPGNRGRIGISRVMIPSIVSRSLKTGFLAEAGLETGDRIISAIWNGKTFELRYWNQVLKFFELVSQTNLSSANPNLAIELTIERFSQEAATNEKHNGSRPKEVIQIHVPNGWIFDRNSWLNDTGIVDAQLTISKDEGEPANGLLFGDRLIEWDGKRVDSVFDLTEIMNNQRTPQVQLKVLRDGREISLEVTLKDVEVQKAGGKTTAFVLPVSFVGGLEQPDWIVEQYKNPIDALRFGSIETWEMSRSIGKGVWGLFTGEMPLTSLGGPIAIAKVASDTVQIGWQAFLSALALISINLALLNLVPIPILDGGQLVLVGSEAILRRPLAEGTIENFQKIGFVMVLALFVVATYNDLGRFWASMLKSVSGMF